MKTYKIIGKKSYFVEVDIEAEDQLEAEKEFLYMALEDMDFIEEASSELSNIEET